MKRSIPAFVLAALMALTAPADAKPLSGAVSTDGSTSMEKVIGSLGEAFGNAHPNVKVTYNPTGSGAGITAVMEGRCDIGLASRGLKEKEINDGLRSTVLAYDGIALIVNPKNPVKNLTLAEIAKVYTGEIANWKEVGGQDSAIVLIGREAGSGTRDGFESVTKTKDACKYRQELTSTGDVITTVSQNPAAIGEAMAVMMVSGNVANMPSLFESVRFLTSAVASEMSYSGGLQREALFSIALVLFFFIMLITASLNFFLKKGREA